MGIPQHWRVRKQRYALVGESCNQCGTKHFSPWGACPACSQVVAYDLFGIGRNGKGYVSQLAISLPPATQYLSLAPWRWSERSLEQPIIIT